MMQSMEKIEIDAKTFAGVIRAAAQKIDWEEFGITVATMNPDLFIQIVDTLTGRNWENQVVNMVDAGKSKVDVVKYVRDTAPMSLGEAKSWVESRFPQLDAPME